MPTISMFYGILIRMFFNDTEKHNLPHIQQNIKAKLLSIPFLTANCLQEQYPYRKRN